MPGTDPRIQHRHRYDIRIRKVCSDSHEKREDRKLTESRRDTTPGRWGQLQVPRDPSEQQDHTWKIERKGKERIFEYLKEEVGLIKKTSGSYDNYIVYCLTKKGKKIVRLGGWLKYIERQDKIEERQEKKENAELKITEFQSRNQNLPYIVSISGVIISIVALIINCSSNDGVLTQKKEHIMEYKSEKIKFETKKNLDLDTLLIERK